MHEKGPWLAGVLVGEDTLKVFRHLRPHFQRLFSIATGPDTVKQLKRLQAQYQHRLVTSVTNSRLPVLVGTACSGKSLESMCADRGSPETENVLPSAEGGGRPQQEADTPVR